MKEGIQEYKMLYADIQRYGCLFLCLIQIKHREDDLSVEDINNLYRHCVKAGYMETDCFVNNSLQILRHLEYPVQGIKKYDVVNYNSDNPKEIDVARSSILYLRKPGYSHFILKYPDGQAWDPLSPLRPAAAQYKVTEVREIYY